MTTSTNNQSMLLRSMNLQMARKVEVKTTELVLVS